MRDSRDSSGIAKGRQDSWCGIPSEPQDSCQGHRAFAWLYTSCFKRERAADVPQTCPLWSRLTIDSGGAHEASTGGWLLLARSTSGGAHEASSGGWLLLARSVGFLGIPVVWAPETAGFPGRILRITSENRCGVILNNPAESCLRSSLLQRLVVQVGGALAES